MNGNRQSAFDLVVVGGGPAGAAAALFCARRGRRVAVIDPLGVGGALVNVERLPDYPGFADGVAGWDLAASLGEALLLAGVELVLGRARALRVVEAGGLGFELDVDGHALSAPAVLLAGGRRPRPLPGAGAADLEGRGVSYCAACDAGLFAGRAVVVVGGGDTAMAEAVTLAASAAEVTVVFPEPAPPAAAAWTAAVAALGNVTLRAGLEVRDVSGAAQGVRVEAVDLARGGTVSLLAAGVFGALGGVPNSELVAGLAPLDEAGCVRTDGAFRAGPPGLYAAGDVRSGSAGQAITAAGEGAAAGLAVHEHLTRLGR
ncbi:MAG: NAD(P)/FAD-dependent oxidoreductase [Acidimicrobiales bacterium]